MIFARIYDSRIADNADFGPGWRPSLAEELLVDGNAVTYVDDAGARHGFAWGAAGYAASPPTPRHAATTLVFEDAGGTRVATIVDGETTRTFERADEAGTRYVIRTRATRARTLAFDYAAGGRLARVSHGGATLFEIERDAEGRIARLRDDHGGVVRYAYDADGRLETAQDLAGSDWRYLYRDDGRLGGALDPLDRPYLAASYDELGRVTQAYSGPLHTYEYGAGVTTVVEGTGDEHTLLRNPAGVTTAVSSTTGDDWELTLDQANRVSTLTLPERSVAYTYGDGGRVESLAETVDGETTVRWYDHDAEGRLIAVRGGERPVDVAYLPGNVRIVAAEEVFEYDLDEFGRVVSVRQDDEDEVRAEYNDAGDLVSLSQGNRVARFGRDELGRIVDASFPDGETARYLYDDLGNRIMTEYGDGRFAMYDFDASGKPTSAGETGWSGAVPRPAVPALPRSELPRSSEVGGEGKNRSVRFHAGAERAVVGFGPAGTAAQVSGTRYREAWSPRGLANDRWSDARAVLAGDRTTRLQPDYGTLAFGGGFRVRAGAPPEFGIPRLHAARALPRASMALFEPGGGLSRRSALLSPREYRVLAAPATVATPPGINASCADQAVVNSVNACMLAAAQGKVENAGSDLSESEQEELRRLLQVVEDTMIEYRDLGMDDDGRAILAQAAVGTTTSGKTVYFIWLNIDAISAEDDVIQGQRSLQDYIHDILAHEYAHNILYPADTSHHPQTHQDLWDRLETVTEDCD